MRGRSWSDEQIALLRTMWAAGATAAAIARRLGGPSRSAVLGKVFRLRLVARPASSAENTAPNGSAWSAPRREPAGAGTADLPEAAPARRRVGRSRKPAPAAPPNGNRRGKSLLDLDNQCCRWPHGRPGAANFFFCGAPGADVERGIPYCGRHMRRAYPALDLAADTGAERQMPHARAPVASANHRPGAGMAMQMLRRIAAMRLAGL